MSTTFFSNLDSRSKLLTTILHISYTLSLPFSLSRGLFFSFAFIFMQLLLSGGLWHGVKRMLLVLPFSVSTSIALLLFHQEGQAYEILNFTIYGKGLEKFVVINSKALLSFSSLFFLQFSSSFSRFLAALAWFKVPSLFLTLFAFTRRYISIIGVEFSRMKRAATARGFQGKWFWQIGFMGSMVGSLFLRSYNRSERVYRAMLSRGFKGDYSFVELKFKSVDFLYMLSSFLIFGVFWLS
ncbi:MAG: energy-coupling factor transporter transmembrane component T family protein [Myxococcota bacterium]